MDSGRTFYSEDVLSMKDSKLASVKRSRMPTLSEWSTRDQTYQGGITRDTSFFIDDILALG